MEQNIQVEHAADNAFAEDGSEVAFALAVTAFGLAALQLTCLIWVHCDNSFMVQAEEEDSLDGVSLSDIRLTFQTLPILLVANTVFNFAYTMMIGPFLSESCQMNLRLGDGSAQISGAFFNLADSIAIVLFIPIFEGFVFPGLARLRGRPVTVQEKLVCGFFWAAAGMAAATVVEFCRRSSPVLAPPGWQRHVSKANFPGMNFTAGSGPRGWQRFEGMMGTCTVGGVDYCSNCAPRVPYPFCEGAGCPEPIAEAGIYMSAIHGWWMLVPFSFIGIGEILVMPVLYHYAYSLTPTRTQCIIQAVNLVFQGAYPPALVGVVSTLLAKEQPNNLNRGHIEYFYYIALVIIAFGTPLFFLVSRTCKIQQPQRDDSSGEEAIHSMLLHPSMASSIRTSGGNMAGSLVSRHGRSVAEL
ncbi:unnamed protein product [Polarella glacialis]|uniref:Uncharacterized protein n=1 Tax=Polarella glacialis TaxID=89957 RepID=A0A813KPG0_POLGL|nr:unnamed protein product [Polarella glacialis]